MLSHYCPSALTIARSFTISNSSPKPTQHEADRIVTEVYGEMETSVATFIESLDDLLSHQYSQLCPCTLSHNVASSSAMSIAPAVIPCNAIAAKLVETIKVLSAKQSRDLWTKATETVENILELNCSRIPITISELERQSNARLRTERAAHKKSLDAARAACRKQWQEMIQRKEREWRDGENKNQAEHLREMESMKVRAEGAESSRRVLSSQLDVAEETGQRLDYELGKVESELERTQKEKDEAVARLEKKLDASCERERRANEDLIDANKQLKQTGARLETKARMLCEVRDDLREVKAELRTRTKDLSLTRTKYREMENECRAVKQRANDLERSLQFVGSPNKN